VVRLVSSTTGITPYNFSAEVVERSAFVCENSKGVTYLVMNDVSERRVIEWNDDHGFTYEYDSLIRVFSGEDGREVKRIFWGTSHAFYGREIGAEGSNTEDTFQSVGGRLEKIIVPNRSSPRFPESPL